MWAPVEPMHVIRVLQTLREHDIEVEPEFIMKTRQTEVEGFKMMERLLESEERPTAIYCANDISAVGMLKMHGK